MKRYRVRKNNWALWTVEQSVRLFGYHIMWREFCAFIHREDAFAEVERLNASAEHQ